MSYVFDVNEETIWSPSSRVGAFYVKLADALAAWADVDHGISPLAEDYYIIAASEFEKFVQTLVLQAGFDNQVFARLAGGFIDVSIVLMRRAGIAIPSEILERLDSVQELSRVMPDL